MVDRSTFNMVWYGTISLERSHHQRGIYDNISFSGAYYYLFGICQGAAPLELGVGLGWRALAYCFHFHCKRR